MFDDARPTIWNPYLFGTLVLAVTVLLGLGGWYDSAMAWFDRIVFALCLVSAAVVIFTGRVPDEDEAGPDGATPKPLSFWLVLRSAAFLAIAFVVLAGSTADPMWEAAWILFAVLAFGRLFASLWL